MTNSDTDGDTDSDPRDQISRLEAQIERLAETIEGCRKIIVISRVAIVAGGLLVIGVLFGSIRSDLMVLSIATTAVVGGIVVLGSNTSTAQQASAEMADAEALRTRLIDQLDLQDIPAGLRSLDRHP